MTQKVLRLKRARRSPRAEIVAIRLTPELESAVQDRAELEATSVSEVIRSALYAYLDDSGPPPLVCDNRSRQDRESLSPRLPVSSCHGRIRERGPRRRIMFSDSSLSEGSTGEPTNFGQTTCWNTARACQSLWSKPSGPMRFPDKGLQQAKRYAQLLDVPFAYSTNGRGIVEDDRNTGIERANLVGFPPPDILWARYREWKGIRGWLRGRWPRLPFTRALRNPDGSAGRRGTTSDGHERVCRCFLRGDKRLLLTMATGTGKTFVSMQIVWKLWRSAWRPGRNPRFLVSSRPKYPR